MPTTNLVQPDTSQLQAGLRSLCTVIDAGKGRSQAQEEVLEVLQRFWGSEVSLAGLSPISPEELAAAIPDGQLRRQLLGVMIIVGLIDQKADPGEVKQIEAFAAALGTQPAALKQLKMISKDRLTLAMLDTNRRSGVTRRLRDQARSEGGVHGIRRAILEVRGKYENKALSKRYHNLSTYPAGTLGQAYWQFCHDNGFSFPGEKGSLPESMAVHDCTHIIGGYDTTMADEVMVLGFTAGRLEGEDVFNALIFGMLQFHIGVTTAAVAKGQTGLFNPETFLRAFHRGSAMNVNINDASWDMWAAFQEPLSELRSRYNVLPRTDH